MSDDSCFNLLAGISARLFYNDVLPTRCQAIRQKLILAVSCTLRGVVNVLVGTPKRLSVGVTSGRAHA